MGVHLEDAIQHFLLLLKRNVIKNTKSNIYKFPVNP